MIEEFSEVHEILPCRGETTTPGVTELIRKSDLRFLHGLSMVAICLSSVNKTPQRRSFTYERWFRAGIPWISSWMTRILNILGTTTLELVNQRGCGRQPRLT